MNNAEIIISELERAGYEAYLAGGCVRDMIMGRKPHDFDVTTSALPKQVERVFAGQRVIETGIKHGTVTVLIGGSPVEVTTYRTDGSYSDGRHPDSVEFTTSLKEDLARRDFTMNAMAWSSREGLVDPYGGKADIEAGRVRAVGHPADRFQEDALRILRALRFASALGFEIEPDTGRAMYENKELLKRISAERVQSELTKLLTGGSAGQIVLKYVDIIGVAVPELLAMKDFDQKNRHHVYDVLEHSAWCLSYIEAKPHLRWAALLHDVGKPETFSLDEEGTGHFYGHGKKSARMAEAILGRLRFDKATLRRVVKLVECHDMQIELTPKGVRRAAGRLGEDILRDLILLKRADNLAQNPEFHCRQEYFDRLEALLDEIISEKQCFSLKKMAIDGRDLIAMGVPQGPAIGKLLNSALEAVIDGRTANEKEALLQYVEDERKKEKKEIEGGNK